MKPAGSRQVSSCGGAANSWAAGRQPAGSRRSVQPAAGSGRHAAGRQPAGSWRQAAGKWLAGSQLGAVGCGGAAGDNRQAAGARQTAGSWQAATWGVVAGWGGANGWGQPAGRDGGAVADCPNCAEAVSLGCRKGWLCVAWLPDLQYLISGAFIARQRRESHPLYRWGLAPSATSLHVQPTTMVCLVSDATVATLAASRYTGR
jgi:hypothetical protein